MNHRPRKRFGQNFLQSQPVINNIVTALDLRREDNVLEIGPGLGALTQPLLRMLNKLVAVEIDRDLQASLMNSLGASGKLHLVAADALTLDYGSFGNELRIVGNLPYNISTPLLLYLLTFASHIKDMHFMLQKEVVNRLAGQPGSKAYGRLSVMVQYHCEVLPLFDVPPDAFYPEPKVDSSIVRLTPHAVPLYPAVSLEGLQSLVAMAFSMRRKTLANNLKPAITAEQLGFLGINPALRPEQISIAEYIRITDFLQLDTCPVKTVE